MRVAPIIHTRTFSCDFNSEFMVRPDCFFDSDIKWARKNVLGATSSIDSLQGERLLIVDNGKYRIAGVVGFLKNICAKCNLSEEYAKKSEELFCDDKGRLVYAFIGVVIDTSNSESYGKITYDYLWNIYLDMIYPIWKRTYQEVITRKFENIEFQGTVNNLSLESCKIGVQELYETNPEIDYELFEYYLCNKSNNNFTFCTNIVDYNVAKQCDFSIITTSQNIITRLKRYNVGNPNFTTSEQPVVQPQQSEPFEASKKAEENKKKSFGVLTICLLILVVIILILLLLMGNSSQAGQLALTVMNCQNSAALLKVAIIMC